MGARSADEPARGGVTGAGAAKRQAWGRRRLEASGSGGARGGTGRRGEATGAGAAGALEASGSGGAMGAGAWPRPAQAQAVKLSRSARRGARHAPRRLQGSRRCWAAASRRPSRSPVAPKPSRRAAAAVDFAICGATGVCAICGACGAVDFRSAEPPVSARSAAPAARPTSRSAEPRCLRDLRRSRRAAVLDERRTRGLRAGGEGRTIHRDRGRLRCRCGGARGGAWCTRPRIT